MNHLDLFSGIGGFSLAVDAVWPDANHTFVEHDPFCQKVLKKHWPESEIYGDIKTFTNPQSGRKWGSKSERNTIGKSQEEIRNRNRNVDLITGGFPCQPFSQAGQRKGTSDDRYLWPEMFRVITEFEPTWVIAENVSGLITWSEGMVLEQVCIDLESEGYEVQPLIIPAVSVNAPHRRDRVWIIANRESSGARINKGGLRNQFIGGSRGSKAIITHTSSTRSRDNSPTDSNKRWNSAQDRTESIRQDNREASSSGFDTTNSIWEQDWVQVAAKFCRVDDGIPKRLDRARRLKALGNAIVPQVAIEIMKEMKIS